MKKLLLIAVLITTLLVSCKKEKSVEPSVPATTLILSELFGKWANNDSDPYTRDTIYIYEVSGNYYMTCPDNGTSMGLDTMGINIISNTFTIPAQTIYSTVSLSGDGNKVLPNQLNINWTTSSPSNLTYTNVIYIKQ